MVATAGAPVSEQAQRRMRPHFSLQEWLDTEASKYAWAVTFASAAARASSFYSGGALSLPRLLGPFGMAIFDGVSGVGLAFGAEMLSSIAGRAWQRNTRLSRDALMAPNMRRSEREALRLQYQDRAKLDFAGMCLGIIGTICAAFMFMFTANPDHSIAAILNELLVTVLLVGITTYLGVFNTTPRADPAQLAQAQAMEIRGAVTDAAGRRIASGVYAPDDVYTVASQLPRGDKEQFVGALVRPDVDDPLWGTREMCDWLGLADLPSEQDEAAARRRVTRLLQKAARDDARIHKNDKGQYQVPRSLALVYLADLYIEFQRAKVSHRRVTGESSPRHPGWLTTLVGASDAAQDGSHFAARSDAGRDGVALAGVAETGGETS